MSPTNFPATNPQVLEKTIETRGENLLKGLANMLADLGQGQLTHTDSDAFEVGGNIATTPGKVVHRTPVYELIHYAPPTKDRKSNRLNYHHACASRMPSSACKKKKRHKTRQY